MIDLVECIADPDTDLMSLILVLLRIRGELVDEAAAIR